MARRYCAFVCGTKIAKLITGQISTYSTGCWRGQTDGGAPSVRSLPNSSRVAWVNADTGFHFANSRNAPGRAPTGTKVFAMKLIGKITMKDAWLTVRPADGHDLLVPL